MWKLLVPILVLAMLAASCSDSAPPPDLTRISNAINDWTSRLGCSVDGVFVEDEQKATFVAGGMYRLRAKDRDMKLDIDGEYHIELPQDEDVYVEVEDGTKFEVNQHWSGGGACIYFSNPEDRATRTARAKERKRTEAARAAAERSERAQAERERELQEQRRKQAEEARERLERSRMSDAEILLDDCLDPFDGNHNGFEKQIRDQRVDPGSMDTISTNYLVSEESDYDREIILGMRYRTRDRYGVIHVLDAVALVDVDTCESSVISYGWND